MKICSRCKQTKSFEEFYRQPPSAPTKDGFTYWCRACYAENYANNRERQKLSNQRARIRRRYGLELEEYESLIAQGCSVCSRPGRIVLDHDHVSNSVRAPLCNACNVALGAASDDPGLLRSLAEYLESHAAQ